MMLVLDTCACKVYKYAGVVVHVNKDVQVNQDVLAGCALGDFHQPVKAVPLRRDSGAEIMAAEWLCCLGRPRFIVGLSKPQEVWPKQVRADGDANPSAIHA